MSVPKASTTDPSDYCSIPGTTCAPTRPPSDADTSPATTPLGGDDETGDG